jgi:hypothetical protein
MKAWTTSSFVSQRATFSPETARSTTQTEESLKMKLLENLLAQHTFIVALRPISCIFCLFFNKILQLLGSVEPMNILLQCIQSAL